MPNAATDPSVTKPTRKGTLRWLGDAAEVITVAPIPKAPQSKKKPKASKSKTPKVVPTDEVIHRRMYCTHLCDVCQDAIPRHYCNRIPNPRYRQEMKRANKLRKSGEPYQLPKIIITECFDCYTVRREADRAAYQRWCSTHRLHALDRMLRLMAWCGIEVDQAMAWRRFTVLDKPGQVEALKEIEECTAGMIDDYREITTHPFAEAMDEMAALELRPPPEMPEDDATDATVEIEVEVFRLTGETEIVLNDSGWRKLHNAVLYYLNSYWAVTLIIDR